MKNLLNTFILAMLIAVTLNAQESMKVGDKAVDFNLKGTDGEMHSMMSMKAEGYILTFTCNHCPYSVMYEDRLIALEKEYGPKGYHVIAINPNDPDLYEEDSYENMIVRAKEKGFNFPYLFDEGQKIYPQYGATRTPHIFLVDKDMVVRYIGAIDDSARDESQVEERYLANAIDALIAGKNPNPSFTKAIGCSIKSK